MSALIWLVITVWAQSIDTTVPNTTFLLVLIVSVLLEIIWNGAYSRRMSGSNVSRPIITKRGER